jgi:hypothetical protein
MKEGGAITCLFSSVFDFLLTSVNVRGSGLVPCAVYLAVCFCVLLHHFLLYEREEMPFGLSEHYRRSEVAFSSPFLT